MPFIPIPSGNRTYRNLVVWDLSQAPEGTRSVWTYGERPQGTQKVGPASLLCDSVYMVGAVQSHPPAHVGNTISDYYGYYWFGSLPSNVQVIQKIRYEFFVKIAEFFGESPSEKEPYRSFVRKTGSIGAFGGTSFTRSHIFDYDDRIDQAEDYDLVRRMSYEMSHNWLGPKITEKEIDWFYEGLKNCLSVSLFATGSGQDTISKRQSAYFAHATTLIHLSIFLTMK